MMLPIKLHNRLTDEHIRATMQDKPRRAWRPQKLLLNLILVAGFAYMCWLAATNLLPAAIDHELDRMPTADVMATAPIRQLPVRDAAPVADKPVVMVMEATAYSWGCGNGDGYTATMTRPRPGVVAVDPRVIPLGSRVEIDGRVYYAEDVGGAIKGHRIDIFMPSRAEALEYGRRMVEVTVLAD